MGERRSLRLSDIMDLETQELINPRPGTRIYYNGIQVQGQPTFDMSGPVFDFTLVNGNTAEIVIGMDTIPIENGNGDEEINQMEIEIPNTPSTSPNYIMDRNSKRKGMGGSRKRKTGRRKKRTTSRKRRTTRRKKSTR